jgi:hypothetical protein
MPAERTADLYAALRAETLRLAEVGGVQVLNPDSNEAVSPTAIESATFRYAPTGGGEGSIRLTLNAGTERLERDPEFRGETVITPGDAEAYCVELSIDEYAAE